MLLPFSLLERFAVEIPGAAPGQAGRLLDLAYAPDDADHHRVTHCRVRLNGQPPLALPWEAVAALDAPAARLRLAEAPDANAAEPNGDLIWIGDDVLDALVLDLGQRRVTRANDLWLERDGGGLRLAAADTGLRAVARRLSRGRYRGHDNGSLTDWKYVEFLRGSPEAVAAGARYHRRIAHLPAGEIANLAQALPYLHVAELLSLLPAPLAADTLERLPPELRLQAYEELSEAHAVAVLDRLSPDVAADLVGQLQTELGRARLNALPPASSERIVDLLRYPEDTVGGIMTNDVVVARVDLTAGEARVALRPALRQPDFVYFVYVVADEDSRKLRGVLSLRDLLVADDDRRLETLMNPYLLTLAPLDLAQAAAYRVLGSQLAALPVVGQEGRLLGAVTVDVALALVAPRSQPVSRVFA